MNSKDIYPQHSDIAKIHPNRLGCVYEACNRFILNRLNSSHKDRVSMILFEKTLKVLFESREISDQLLNYMIPHSSRGGTNFLTAIKGTDRLVARNRNLKMPVMILFLSDGENNADCLPLVQSMINTESLYGPIVLNTIKFGINSKSSVLKEMAKIGKGKYSVSLDNFQRMKTFVKFSENIDQVFAPFQKNSNSNLPTSFFKSF